MARQSKDGSFASDSKKRDFSKLGAAGGAVAPGTFTWGGVTPALLQECISLVTLAGDGISFAVWTARRGGTITILNGSQAPKYRIESLADAEVFLGEIVDLYKT